MITREARYHDGRTSRTRNVQMHFYRDGLVVIEGAEPTQRYPLAELALSPRLGRAPRHILLPDGARCELAADADLDALFAAGGGRGTAGVWLSFVERRWGAAVLAFFVTAASLAGLVHYGIPELARRVAHSLPAAVDEQLGEGAIEALDRSLFGESELDAPTRERVTRIFESLRAGEGIRPVPRLLFRKGGAAGANAFALPSGRVVVTDALVTLADDETLLAAVLAHELGHVLHRHALRSMLQDAGVGLLVAGALGDFVSISSLAATMPTLLVELQYSRRFESEADGYAVSLLGRHRLPPTALAEALEALERAQGGDRMPAYLSTHPDTAERVREIRAAARRVDS